MKYSGLTLNLKDDPKAIAAYKEHHRQVWPEVERSNRRVDIMGIKIFLLGRRMFIYRDIYAMKMRENRWPDPERLTSDPGPDLNPVVATSQGS